MAPVKRSAWSTRRVPASCSWRRPVSRIPDVVVRSALRRRERTTVSCGVADTARRATSARGRCPAIASVRIASTDRSWSVRAMPTTTDVAPLCHWSRAERRRRRVASGRRAVSPAVDVDVAPRAESSTRRRRRQSSWLRVDSVALRRVVAFAALDSEPRRELEPRRREPRATASRGLTGAVAGSGHAARIRRSERRSAPDVRADNAILWANGRLDYDGGGHADRTSVPLLGRLRMSDRRDGVRAIPGMRLARVARRQPPDRASGSRPIAGLSADGVQTCGSGEDGHVCRSACQSSTTTSGVVEIHDVEEIAIAPASGRLNSRRRLRLSRRSGEQREGPRSRRNAARSVRRKAQTPKYSSYSKGCGRCANGSSSFSRL